MEKRIRLQKVKDIKYTDTSAGPLALDVFRPESAGILPALLLVHGGGWCEGCREDVSAFAARLARAGHVVANIDYRLAPEYPFPAAFDDVRTAATWIHEKIGEFGGNPQRLGGFGISAGAHLIGLLSTEAGSPLTCAVSWGGPMDMREIPVSHSHLGYFYAFMAACPCSDPARYAAASPACRVHAKMPPMLLIHGEFDPLVPPAQALTMAEMGKKQGVNIESYIIPGGSHDPGDPRDQAHQATWDAIMSFYRRHLS